MTYYAPCTILGLLGYSNEQNLVLMEFIGQGKVDKSHIYHM
jgi:hypothetical protein